MNQWQLYNLFKGNQKTDSKQIKEIERMNEKELREAVIEHLLSEHKLKGGLNNDAATNRGIDE